MNKPVNYKEIEEFAKSINLDVKYLLGEKYEEDLYLSYVCYLPDNIVFNVGEFLFLCSVKSLPSVIIFNVSGKVYLSEENKVKVDWS